MRIFIIIRRRINIKFLSFSKYNDVRNVTKGTIGFTFVTEFLF